MSYFDRPERRAAWEKELAVLRREKEARMSGIAAEPSQEAPSAAAEKSAEKSAPFRIKMTYAQLLREESMTKAAVTKSAPQKELQKDVQLEM